MSYKKLILPVGAAITALLASASGAAKVPPEAQQAPSEQGQEIKAGKRSMAPILKRLMYQIGEQAHALTLHKSSSGAVYAAHESHASHASHGSHGSHGSHRSGY